MDKVIIQHFTDPTKYWTKQNFVIKCKACNVKKESIRFNQSKHQKYKNEKRKKEKNI